MNRVGVMTPTPCRETIVYVDAEPEKPAVDRLHHIRFDDGWVSIDGYVARSWITVLVDRVRAQFATLRRHREPRMASLERVPTDRYIPDTNTFATPSK